MRIFRGLVLLTALVSLVFPAPALAQSSKPPANTSAGSRVTLRNVATDLMPNSKNVWQCSCDTDGCWPGCFTIASASILKYWSGNGFPNLWVGKEVATLQRLRDLFPNLQCTGNGNGNGYPGDTVFDAADVAYGFNMFVKEKGYNFTITPIYEPTFDKIKSEIDAGRPLIGVFGVSPWGSHAGTIIGYDTTKGRQAMIVRPNLQGKPDTDLEWGAGYAGFGLVTIVPGLGKGAYPIAPKSTFEVMVDDRDPGFAQFGDWAAVDGFGLGGSSRWLRSADTSTQQAGEDTAWVQWSPDLPFDGMWEVLAWMPKDDEDDSFSRSTTYKILDAEGMHLSRRSQHDSTQGWMSLGAFPFVAGGKGGVRLGNLTTDDKPRVMWADAMRFVWRGPLVVLSEDDTSKVYLVRDGRRHLIPTDATRAGDPRTFDALRLGAGDMRKLTVMQLSQYPEGDPLPSIYGSWVGQYFNNALLSSPASLVKASPALGFVWDAAPPAPNMSALGFSARWTRVMAMPEGKVPVSVNAVGGVRLWVDGRLEIDAWNASDTITNALINHQRVISVTGSLHTLELEYVNRDGAAQVNFGNLPPFIPIVTDPISSTGWTNAVTKTLSWLDAGDPDSPGSQRAFYATLWKDGSTESASSNWISDTNWVTALPADGVYLWRVSASDGSAVSDWSEPRRIQVDRSPPWAQMQSAEFVGGPVLGAQVDASGAVKITASQPYTAARGIQLMWWATDTASGPSSYDVQYREIVHAMTNFSQTVEMREVEKPAQEVVVQNGKEVTRASTVLETVPTITYQPIYSFETLTQTQWITLGVALPVTSTVFVGNPGSTYEFRVRARDWAGNEQPWYEGYSIQAQMDLNTAPPITSAPTITR